MTLKELVEKYWQEFEVLAFNLVKKELAQEIIEKATITQSVKDGGYDGEFLLYSKDNTFIKVLFEAKLRSNVTGNLPLQDFAKAIIISIVNEADILYIVTNVRFSKTTLEILEDYSKFVPLGIKLANGLTVKKFILQEELTGYNIEDDLFKFLVTDNTIQYEQNLSSIRKNPPSCPLYGDFDNDPQTLEIRNLFNNKRGILTITGNVGSGKSTLLENICCFYQNKGNCVSIIDLSKCFTYKDLIVEILEKTLGLSLTLINQIDDLTFKTILIENNLLEATQEDIEILDFIFSKETNYSHDYSYLFTVIVRFYEKLFRSTKKRINVIVGFKNAAYANDKVLQLLLYFLKSNNTFSSIVELTNEVYLRDDVDFWDNFKQNVMSLATYENFNLKDWSVEHAKHYIQKRINGLTDPQLTSLVKKFGCSPAEISSLIELIDNTNICVNKPQNLFFDEIMRLNSTKYEYIYYKCFEYLQLSNSDMLYLYIFLFFLSGEIKISILYEFFVNKHSFENLLYKVKKSNLFYVNGGKITVKNAKIEKQLNVYCEEHLTEFTISNVENFLKDRLKTLNLTSEKLLIFKCKCEYFKSPKTYIKLLISLGDKYLQLQHSHMAKDIFEKCIDFFANNQELHIHETQKLQVYLGMVETLIWKIGENDERIQRYLTISSNIIKKSHNTTSSFHLLVLKYHLLSYQYFHSQNMRTEALDVAKKGVQIIEKHQLYDESLELCGKMWRFYAVSIKEDTQDLKACLDIFDKGFINCKESAKFLFGYIIHNNMNVKNDDYNKRLQIKLDNYNRLFPLDKNLSIDERLHYRVNVAALKFLQKKYDDAWDDYELLLDESLIFGITREKVRILNDMANICWIKTELDEARKMYYTAKSEAEKSGCFSNYWPILINLVSFEVNSKNYKAAWDIHLILNEYLNQKCSDLLLNKLGIENQEYIRASITIHLKNLYKIYSHTKSNKVLYAIKELYKSSHQIVGEFEEQKLINSIKRLSLKNTMFDHNGLFLLKN